MDRYTKADIERWLEDNQWEIEALEPKLERLEQNPKADHVLGTLALTYGGVGYTEIARGNYALARQAFSRSCRLMLRMYELHENGYPMKRENLSTGNFHFLLLAHAAADIVTAEAFSTHYRIDHGGPSDSTYIGAALKALTEGRFQDASTSLSKPRPDVDEQFSGYVECLDAIARRDEAGFEGSLISAADAWERFAGRHFRGQPDVVCFAGGIGFANLAKSVAGLQLRVADDRIPKAMLV